MFPFSKKKELTTQQTALLEALRDPDNKGDLKKCLKVAGYAANAPVNLILRPIKDEVLEIARDILAANAVKASLALVAGIDDPVQPGVKELTVNAEKILDHVGIIKGEVIKIETGGGRIALIPARKPSDEVSSDT